MLSRLLHVRHPTAKQAVITAIDLLGLYTLCEIWRLNILQQAAIIFQLFGLSTHILHL